MLITRKELVDILKRGIKDRTIRLNTFETYTDFLIPNVPEEYKGKYRISNTLLRVEDRYTDEDLMFLYRFVPIDGGSVKYSHDEVYMRLRSYRLSQKLRRKYRGA